MKLPKLKPTIELTKKGVFHVRPGERTRVADPIEVVAFGTRAKDQTVVAELRFKNFDGEWQHEWIDRSQFVSKNRQSLVAHLADHGYDWPGDVLDRAILETLRKQNPARRFLIVGAPGWTGEVFATTEREYGPKKSKHRTIMIDAEAGASIAGFTLGGGSLNKWKNTVASKAKSSATLRLSIAAAFAAPLLRPLNMDSFGLNLWGDTSIGKTGCMFAAASVAGVISDGGLPGWSDSIPALEELAVGHRDTIFPLDETGNAEEDERGATKKAKNLTYALSRNRVRNLSKGYAKGRRLHHEFRVVAISSSEFSFGDLATTKGKPRMGGEEVRLIDVPAKGHAEVDIFDDVHAADLHTASSIGRALVDELKLNAQRNQGFPLDKFLKRLVKDKKWIRRVAKFRTQFESALDLKVTTGAEQRLAANFSLLYAAARLAIEYDVLPWGSKSTRVAITSCMARVFEARRRTASNAPVSQSSSDVLKNFKAHLDGLKIHALPNSKSRNFCDDKEGALRRHAEAFWVDGELWIKAKCWSSSLDTLKPVLRAQSILLRGGRTDTLTQEKKIAGIRGKLRFYVVDTAKLDAALSATP